MDIKNIDTFIVVAELRNFTKAANKLGYSQSTISFQIKQLEDELNVQLFERINRTVKLTQRGEEILKYAQKIKHLSEDMKKEISPEKELSGHVSIAIASSIAIWFLNNKYEDFHIKYPNISLSLIPVKTKDMFNLLNHNEVDFVYTLDSQIFQSDYIIAKEEKCGVHFITGKNGSLWNKKNIAIEDIVNQPFILSEKNMSYRRILDEYLASKSLGIQPILEYGSTDLSCSLVAKGIGISFLPDFISESYVEKGLIQHVNVNDFSVDIWKQLIYHQNKWMSPLFQTVKDYLIEETFF